MRIYRPGDQGAEILDIQHRLIGAGEIVDPTELIGRYGASTESAVRSFQARRSLPVDGLVGPDTWAQLVEAGLRLGDRTLYLHAPHYRGDDVRLLQRKLNALGFDAGREDGVFGAATDRAVRDFQRNVADEPDGVVGLHTIVTLERMRPIEDAPSRALVREEEELLNMQTSIAGQPIAIDPGESGDAAESDPRVPIARALVLELVALGAKPELLAEGDEDPSPSERAARANERGAAMCISLAVGPARGELACAYFGSSQTHSPAGKRLAELILRELEREFGRPGRLHPLTITMLRETRMPAVQVLPPSGTGDQTFAMRVAHAVASGIRGFYRE